MPTADTMRQIHARVDRSQIRDLAVITRAPETAICRAGLAALYRMVQQGEVDRVRQLVAENVSPMGPRPR